MTPVELFISALLANSQPLFAFLGIAGAVVEVQLLVLAVIAITAITAITAIALLSLSVYAITTIIGNSEGVEKPVGPEDLEDLQDLKRASPSPKVVVKKENVVTTHASAVQKIMQLHTKIEQLKQEKSDLSKMELTPGNKIKFLQAQLDCVQADSDMLEMQAQAAKLALAEYQEVYPALLVSDPNAFDKRKKLGNIVQDLQDRVDENVNTRAARIAKLQKALDDYKAQNNQPPKP